MFDKSMSVPQNYKNTAKILKELKENKLELKDCVYSKDSTINGNKQRYINLAKKILEKIHHLDHILRTTQILSEEPRLDPWITRVLIFELIWKKDLKHPNNTVQTIASYKKEIHDALATFKEDESLKPKKQVLKPRYARVNTFKMSVADVIDQLSHEMIFLPDKHETYEKHLEAVANLQYNNFMIDFHIKEMLVFHSNNHIMRHQFYKDYILILQDKASCLSPLLLDPPVGSIVLDMCAAPGMKTNYLANQVGKNGRVYAVERNQQRYKTMLNLLNMQGIPNVFCMNGDSLKLEETFVPTVEYLLVDPNCSESGITDRVEFEKSKPVRINRLSNFQTVILRSALTNFPNVKRVVYSTCSINPEENEEVVANVLNSDIKFQLVNLQEKMGNTWKNFGSDKYGEIGTSCLYARPEDDFTNGFFVALFERVEKKMKRKLDKSNLNDENIEEQSVVENIDLSRKKRKRNKDKTDDVTIVEENGYLDENIKEKKKKRKEKTNDTVEEIEIEIIDIKEKKKKRKEKTNDTVEEIEIAVEQNIEIKEKKKKRKEKTNDTVEEIEIAVEQNIEIKEKKKKRKEKTNDTVEEIEIAKEQNVEIKEKKKKRKQMENYTTEEQNTEVKEKKKKKSKKDGQEINFSKQFL